MWPNRSFLQIWSRLLKKYWKLHFLCSEKCYVLLNTHFPFKTFVFPKLIWTHQPISSALIVNKKYLLISFNKPTLRENCPNTELFLDRIFLYRREYGDLRSKSPYSVRIQENTDQKKHRIWTLCTQCHSLPLVLFD